MKNLWILLIICLPTNCFAQEAQYITKGTPAPFSGDLLTLEQTKALNDDSLDKSSLQKQLDLETQNNTLLTQEKTILITQNQKLVEAANSEARMSTLEKGLWFLGGIVLTGLAVKAAASLKP
jgi:hypothetical protein